MNKFNTIYKILSQKEGTKFNFIILLNILNFLLELLCIISIPIFTSLLINSNLVLDKVDRFLPIVIKDNIIIFGVIGVIIIFILKNLFSLFLAILQNSFFKKVKIKLSTKLFEGYLFGSYENHLNHEPAKISRNATIVIQDFSYYLVHLINLVREISVIAMIFIVLIYIYPLIITSIILFLLFCTYIYFITIKPKLKSKAEQNQKLNKTFIQVVFESFGAIKDLKILNKEKDIFKLFFNKMNEYENNLLFFSVFEKLPRLILEIASIGLILVVSLFMFTYNNNLEEILPVLALIVISIIRLLPAFTALNTSFYFMKIFDPSVQILEGEVRKFNNGKINIKDNIIKQNYKNNLDINKNFIVLENVSFNYPNNSLIKPLKDVNMAVERGDIVGIIGKTGAGKTTLMNIMTGLLTPSMGSVFFKNNNINNKKREWIKNIGYVSQNIFLMDETIEKNIAFNFNDEEIDRKKLNKAIEISKLSNKIKALPNGLQTKVGNDGMRVSGGEKQRIAIARAIYKDPEILFFDEFTSAIDAKTEQEIIDEIEKISNNKTIIIIAHRSTTISKCKNVWKLENGVIKKV